MLAAEQWQAESGASRRPLCRTRTNPPSLQNSTAATQSLFRYASNDFRRWLDTATVLRPSSGVNPKQVACGRWMEIAERDLHWEPNRRSSPVGQLLGQWAAAGSRG